jgi:hypothetical protein
MNVYAYTHTHTNTQEYTSMYNLRHETDQDFHFDFTKVVLIAPAVPLGAM